MCAKCTCIRGRTELLQSDHTNQCSSEYFRVCLHCDEKVVTFVFVSVLTKAGITPSTSTSYTLAKINDAISTAMNKKKVEINCSYDKPVSVLHGMFIDVEWEALELTLCSHVDIAALEVLSVVGACVSEQDEGAA